MTWLEEQTGVSDREWIEFVQTHISENTVPTTDPQHGETIVTAWIVELTEKVLSRIPTDKPVDGNMWAARVMAAVLALWYHHVQWAKIRDPRRPIELRQRANVRLTRWRMGMDKIVMTRREDIAEIFPGQSWENPFDKDATDGTFI